VAPPVLYNPTPIPPRRGKDQLFTERASQESSTTGYRLQKEILPPMETLAQSVSAMASATTPAATIPLVCALVENSTCLAYGLATGTIGQVVIHLPLVLAGGWFFLRGKSKAAELAESET
jgi:hypothetical protein